MGIMDEFKKEGDSGEVATGSRFLKGVDFDVEGQILTVVGMEKFVPENSEYGIKNVYGAGGKIVKENYFVKEGILEEGQSFKYRFTQGDMPKEFDNSSVSFFFAFSNLNPNEGDEVSIKRNKKSSTDVEWTLKKI